MVLFAVPPILTATALILSVHPNRNDPATGQPDRRRRDRGAIISLLLSAVIIEQLWTHIAGSLPPFAGKMRLLSLRIPRSLRMASGPRSPPRPGLSWPHLAVAAVLLWQATDEALLRSRRQLARHPSLSHEAHVAAAEPSRDVVGTTDITISFTPLEGGSERSVYAKGVPGPPPQPGDAWTDGVRYSPTNPSDAAARNPAVYWDEVAWLTSLALGFLGLFEMERRRSGTPMAAVWAPHPTAGHVPRHTAVRGWKGKVLSLLS